MPDIPKIDIRPDHWEIVRSILQKHVPQHAVWAFGSRAKWTAKEYSDLDLAIVTDKPLSLDISASLSDDFSESDLPYKVDVVDWATTTESFRKIIERDRVVVQEAGPGWDRASELPITEVVEFNPPRKIKRGTVAPFVDMAALPEHQRDISYVAEREFTGGGSRFQNGDTLFARITPCLENGKTAKVNSLPNGSIAHGSTEFIVMAAKVPEYDEDYIYYLARHPEFRTFAEARMEGTSGRQRVSWQALSEFAFPFPSPDQRKIIGSVLRKMDNKIDLNRRINQTLEAMAQAIFQSWFVDFEPVKAKIAAKQEGRDPLRAAMSAISGKPEAELESLPPEEYEKLAFTAALFPDEMEESELGEIPRGWIVSEMRALAEVISKGTTPNKSDLANAKDEPIVPFIKVKDISETGEIARGNLEIIARSIHESSLKRSILKTDDLLFSIAGTIGRTAFVDNDLNGANVNQAIAFIRLKDKLDHFALCWLTLRSIETKNFIASKVVQAVQANASLANVGDIPVRLPGNDVLTKWNDVVSPMIFEYRARLREIRTLATLRDTILPKLMSGELSVEAIAPALEATP